MDFHIRRAPHGRHGWTPDSVAGKGKTGMGGPVVIQRRTGNRVQGFCDPRCPNARHPGQPSFVGELALLPPAPGPPAADDL